MVQIITMNVKMQFCVPQISQLNFLIHAECAFECILGGFASKRVSNLSILKKKTKRHTLQPQIKNYDTLLKLPPLN